MGTLLDKVKSAGQSLSEYTNIVSSAATPTLGGGGGTQPERVQRALVDMTLPAPIAEWLNVPLTSLGFELGTDSIPGWGSDVRSYSVIRNRAGKQQRVIIHIPREVLETDLWWAEVKELPADFTAAKQEPPQPLFVLSEGLNAAHVAYSLMAEPFWESRYGLKMHFVPWRHIEELRVKQEAELKRWLPILLKITDWQTGAEPARSISEISSEDVATLMNVFVNIQYFTDSGAKGWRLFFEQSGMEVLVGQIEVEGPVGVVAGNVLNRLKWQRPFPKYPTHDPMAILVVAISRREDLNEMDRKRVDNLMKTYNIIPPPE